MPAFLRDYGHMLEHEEVGDYIDGRYFSPEARHWMREASRYRAQGGILSVDDEECSDRVLTAVMEAGRKPTRGQEDRFVRSRLLRFAEGLMPVLQEREMRRRGEPFGADYVPVSSFLRRKSSLPSGRELFFDYAAAIFDAPSRGAVKTAFYRWRREVRGTH